ncbi:MAG: hypothetical protein CMJ18_02720 [Phycisphaeraceae bacterium]|nr:hypothetical protein [Phycisphaeraceae bacterium]
MQQVREQTQQMRGRMPVQMAKSLVNATRHNRFVVMARSAQVRTSPKALQNNLHAAHGFSRSSIDVARDLNRGSTLNLFA